MTSVAKKLNHATDARRNSNNIASCRQITLLADWIAVTASRRPGDEISPQEVFDSWHGQSIACFTKRRFRRGQQSWRAESSRKFPCVLLPTTNKTHIPFSPSVIPRESLSRPLPPKQNEKAVLLVPKSIATITVSSMMTHTTTRLLQRAMPPI